MKKLILSSMILSALLSLAAVILFSAPFVYQDVEGTVTNLSGFTLAFDFAGTAVAIENGFFWPLFSLAIIAAFLFASLSGLFKVLMAMTGNGNVSQQSSAASSQIKMRLLLSCVISLVMGLTPLLLNLFTRQLIGYGDAQDIHLGWGAIVTGLLNLFSHISMLGCNIISYGMLKQPKVSFISPK